MGANPKKMKKIKLTQGKYALVDDQDFKFINQWKWCFDNRYAHRKEGVKKIYMHRLIMNTPNDLTLDHINRDRRDNRKTNLRNCTRSENQKNLPKFINGTSQYKGIHKQGKYWRTRIRVNGKKIHGGYFVDEVSAAKKYNELAIKYHGRFANINNL